MNRLIVIFVVAVLGFIAAFSFMRSAQPSSSLLDTMPELEWLRNELKLDPAQFTRAAELHQSYRPRCEALCGRIFEARSRVTAAAAAAGDQLSPELAAALDEQARVHAECQKAMITHLYETAAIMNPEQAGRYLKATLPHALNLSSYEKLQAH